jgi:hypothetical protein
MHRPPRPRSNCLHCTTAIRADLISAAAASRCSLADCADGPACLDWANAFLRAAESHRIRTASGRKPKGA